MSRTGLRKSRFSFHRTWVGASSAMIELSTTSHAPRPASFSVLAQQVYKRYSVDIVVLKGFNMKVPHGNMWVFFPRFLFQNSHWRKNVIRSYAVLGSSGCGKTTLLNCLVGQCVYDSGSIKLNVENRSRIGFMPQVRSKSHWGFTLQSFSPQLYCQVSSLQNTCLYKELSIYENMLIFGYLNGMRKDKVLTVAKEYITRFELPPGERLVETLRWVSVGSVCGRQPLPLASSQKNASIMSVEVLHAPWTH